MVSIHVFILINKIEIKNINITLTYYWNDVKDIVFASFKKSEESLYQRGIINKEKIIQGKVIFDAWKQGYIRITVFKSIIPGRNDKITEVDIPKPGPYKVIIPPNIRKVFVGVYNDSDNDGPPRQPHDPSYGYNKQPTPIYLNKILTNVDLHLAPSNR